MIFNSLPFLFAFLPACLILYYLIARWLPPLRRYFLLAATIAFYSFGGLKYTLLLLASVLLNYIVARLIMAWRERGPATPVLAIAIIANLLLLGLFKYAGPVIDGWNWIAGADIPYLRLVLPIGISFFTFQQIGFLVDLNRGRFDVRNLRDYANFVLFFPTLLAGPITRYEEIDPQLAEPPPRGLTARNICIGLAIFSVGIVKKSMIADTLGLYAAPVFDHAAAGDVPGLLDAWLAAFAYTAQIYFDFAGYSDMAIGVARMFGIILPANFHSPLRSANVTEIWRRWHITLGRWVQTYVFQPLSVPLARLAITRGAGKWMTFWIGFALPTTVAMVTIGVWHGAGATFVVFGLLQSLYMIVNEWWRMGRKKRKQARKASPDGASGPLRMGPVLAVAATVVCFTISVVAFRAANLGVMWDFYTAMLGANGFAGPASARAEWPMGLAGALLMLGFSWLVIFVPPNTQQFMHYFQPVLEWDRWAKIAPPLLDIRWRMTAGWAAVTALLFFLGFIFMMRGTTQFIYFNF